MQSKSNVVKILSSVSNRRTNDCPLCILEFSVSGFCIPTRLNLTDLKGIEYFQQEIHYIHVNPESLLFAKNILSNVTCTDNQ